MHSRRVAPVQFTASPKRVKDKTSIINFDDSENVENFSFPLHSLVFQTLLQRKTTLKVAKNYIESGGMFSRFFNSFSTLCFTNIYILF